MATRDSARALGMGERLGQLREGFRADVIAVDLDCLNTVPTHHPASAVVYAMNSRQVSHVWVDGRLRVTQGELHDLDIERLKGMASDYQHAMMPTRQKEETP